MDPNCYLEIKHGSFQWERPLKKSSSEDGVAFEEDEEGDKQDVEGDKGTGTLKLSSLNLRVGRVGVQTTNCWKRSQESGICVCLELC